MEPPMIVCLYVDVWAVQEYVHFVDLVNNFPTCIDLQNRRRHSRERVFQKSRLNVLNASKRIYMDDILAKAIAQIFSAG